MDDSNREIGNKVNLREIYRYLGYGARIPDDSIQNLIIEVLDALLCVIKPRNIYKVFHSSISESQVVLEKSGRILVFESKNLADNLAQCNTVVLLAATLGIEADKLLQRYEILHMTKAAIVQALRLTVIFCRSRYWMSCLKKVQNCFYGHVLVPDMEICHYSINV